MKRSQIITSIMEDMGALKRAIHARSPKHGPTHAQMGILFMLTCSGPQSLKEIAAHLRVTPSAATQLVNGLVKEKLLTRTEDAEDRRKIVLALTTHGQQELEKAKKVHCASLVELFQPLTDVELLEWQELQRKIIQHLK